MNVLATAYQEARRDPVRYFARRTNVCYLDVSRGEARHVAAADRIVRQEFTFNNETHHLPADFDWTRNPSLDKEWHILLHKCYYLRDLGLAYDHTRNEVYARKWVELLTSWIANVPGGFIDSQVTGRRLQQWILSFHYFVPGNSAAAVTADFLRSFLRSLDEQTAYLCTHLTAEGNHRTIELHGIFLVAVMFPELRRAQEYLAFAREEIVRNLRTDLLGDGVQRELSTDYHHIVLKNFLRIRELAQCNGVTLAPDYDTMLRRALDFSLYVHKPDGTIPAINDGDINDYRSLLKKSLRLLPNEQVRFVLSRGQEGKAPSSRSRLFPDSGYCVLRSDWHERPFHDARYLFFDCAPLGFGSHGHYDLLHFEFAAYGHSLIVDPGRFSYNETRVDGINWRQRFKSTASHNTVVIDGKDQCEYHIGRPDVQPPQAELLRFVSTTGFDFVHGRATSPCYPIVHERKLLFLPADYCLIVDTLTGEGCHSFEQYFHLHPRALGKVTLKTTPTTTSIVSPNLLLAQPRIAAAAIEHGFFSPEYGSKHAAPVVRFSQNGADGSGAVFTALLYPYAMTCPDLEIANVMVLRDGRACAPLEYSGIRVLVRTGGQLWTDYMAIAHSTTPGVYRLDDLECEATLLWLRVDERGTVVGMQGVDVRYVWFRGQLLLDRPAAVELTL